MLRHWFQGLDVVLTVTGVGRSRLEHDTIKLLHIMEHIKPIVSTMFQFVMLISTRKLPVEHGNGIQNKNTREYLLQLGCTPELYGHEKVATR